MATNATTYSLKSISSDGSKITPACPQSDQAGLPKAMSPPFSIAWDDKETPEIHLATDTSSNGERLLNEFKKDPRLQDPTKIEEAILEMIRKASAPDCQASDNHNEAASAGPSRPSSSSRSELSANLDRIFKSLHPPQMTLSCSPDIDDAMTTTIFQASCMEVSIAAQTSGLKTSNILERYGFSFSGTSLISKIYTPQNFDEAFSGLLIQTDIEIYRLLIPFLFFGATAEFISLNQNLNLAPSITLRIHGKYPNGLGRKVFAQRAVTDVDSHRFKGKTSTAEVSDFYHLWFFLPVVNFQNARTDDVFLDDPHYQYLLDKYGKSLIHLPHLNVKVSEDVAVFYLSYNCTSRKSTILLTAPAESHRFTDMCSMSDKLELDRDPFAFISCALSEIINEWSLGTAEYYAMLKHTENWILALKEDMTPEQVNKAKSFILDLRKLRPLQARNINSCQCLITIIRDSIEEHVSARQFLNIPEPAFSRVEKNLHTIASWAESIKIGMKSDLDRIESCVSTLTFLFSVRYDRAIEVNTDTMRKLAESTQDDNYIMKQIAESTKLDSEAMKTIAFLTMLYLPATFVATFFSMGLFDFDFDYARGGIRISPQWWIYFVVTIPLMVGTYSAFRIAYKRHVISPKLSASKTPSGTQL